MITQLFSIIKEPYFRCRLTKHEMSIHDKFAFVFGSTVKCKKCGETMTYVPMIKRESITSGTDPVMFSFKHNRISNRAKSLGNT